MSENPFQIKEETKPLDVPKAQTSDSVKLPTEKGFFYYFLRQRQTIKSIFLLVLFIIAIIIAIFMSGILADVFQFSYSMIYKIQFTIIGYGILIFLFTIYRGVLIYLNDNYKETRLKAHTKFVTTEFSEVDKETRSLNVTQNTMLLLTNEEKEEIFGNLYKEVSEDLKKFLSERIEIEPSKYRYEQIKISFNDLQDRIKKEISSLNKKANVNLSIGVVTTIFAVGFLIVINFNISKEFANWQQFLFFYLPKISLAIFIELFSFYFLSIYKTNLSEIKYYQNELSDIEFKIMAIQSVLLTNNQSIDDLHKTLMSFDRNRIIKDGELTIDLKRIQIENEHIKEFTSKIPNINSYIDYIKSTLTGNDKEEKDKTTN